MIIRIIAASVEDFPEPVGPVIRTSPWESFVSSVRTGGSPNRRATGTRTARGGRPRRGSRAAMNTDALKRETPGTECPKSIAQFSSRFRRRLSFNSPFNMSRSRSGWSVSVFKGRSLPLIRSNGGRMGFR